MNWLHVERRDTPLILAFPHGGAEIPGDLLTGFRSRWWAIRDADWHIRTLYDGLADATMIWTDVSRSVIDCNRDPSGASLYPGQATTGLCPTTTFDGEPLYTGTEPGEADISGRRATWFDPYHAALTAEIERLRARHSRVVLYDCHSIRSRIPRLFDDELPQFNIGTNDGTTCDPDLTKDVVDALTDHDADGWAVVVNGRFKGGWTTRHYGHPGTGVHAIQMELAIRGYAPEPNILDENNWPPVWNAEYAAPLCATLRNVLNDCLEFAR